MTELLPGLPPYEGGCVSPDIYSAGQGLHARPNDEQPYCREDFLYKLGLITRFGVRVDDMSEEKDVLRLALSRGDDRCRVEKTDDKLRVEMLTHRPMDKPTLARLVTETTREASHGRVHQAVAPLSRPDGRGARDIQFRGVSAL